MSSSYLGEQRGPDGLDVGDLSSLDQGLELVGLYRENPVSAALVVFGAVPGLRARGTARRGGFFRRNPCAANSGCAYSDLNTVIGEDERRVRRSQLGGRHCECGLWIGPAGGMVRCWMASLLDASWALEIQRHFLLGRGLETSPPKFPGRTIFRGSESPKRAALKLRKAGETVCPLGWLPHYLDVLHTCERCRVSTEAPSVQRVLKKRFPLIGR